MKTNNIFNDVIKAYLDERARKDELFSVSYNKKNKNINDCCIYIKNRAKRMQSGGCAVVSDDEVFGWAIHYYDEDDIKIGSQVNCHVQTNKTAVKTESKKEKAKPRKREESNVQQLTLF